ncbi:hypothetical protein V2J09_003777 [Rumex salicifolius]
MEDVRGLFGGERGIRKGLMEEASQLEAEGGQLAKFKTNHEWDCAKDNSPLESMAILLRSWTSDIESIHGEDSGAAATILVAVLPSSSNLAEA